MAEDAPPQVEKLAGKVFLIVARDGPDAPQLREADLAAHLAHVEAHWRRYILAGPFRRPGAAAISGSYFLVRGEDRAEVEALMQGDPYFTNGQYAEIEMLEATASIGEFMGGKIWADAAALTGRANG